MKMVAGVFGARRGINFNIGICLGLSFFFRSASSAEKTCLVLWSHVDDLCRNFASVENADKYHGSWVSLMYGIRPAIIVLASALFTRKEEKVTTFSDLHCLSRE